MNKLTLPIAALIVAAFVAYNAAFVIDQAEQGILVQFGEPIGDVITEPGAPLARAVHPGSPPFRQPAARLGTVP